jgi:predicted HD superfamily hydrolase involved in NAD metabolism
VSGVSFEAALAMVGSRLWPDAAEHCRLVADAAAELAAAYGVDVERARLAGLLHDWDRGQVPAALLAAANAHGIEVSDADLAGPHLLHARTGAHALRETFPDLDDEVLDAVSRHTLGAAEMTPLDMVVYIADMIEPSREYAGVDALRDAVGSASLRELFALSYQQSVSHLVAARKRIHPVTVDVWNEYVAVAKP